MLMIVSMVPNTSLQKVRSITIAWSSEVAVLGATPHWRRWYFGISFKAAQVITELVISPGWRAKLTNLSHAILTGWLVGILRTKSVIASVRRFTTSISYRDL